VLVPSAQVCVFALCVFFVLALYIEKDIHTQTHTQRGRERELPSSRVSAVAAMFAPLPLLFYSTAAVLQ
jgi:hypothetical protein